MQHIKTYNKIAHEGLAILQNNFIVNEFIDAPTGILLRSQNLHQEPIPSSVLAVARAGAGVNNIPVSEMTQRGIVVFNTPGANANAVKELVITSLLLASRDIIGGINWTRNLKGEDIDGQVESGKIAFRGPEIYGKSVLVIGLGAIGVKVANALVSLGMQVMGFDPYISVDAAWGLDTNVKKAEQLDLALSQADFVSIHIPMTKVTQGFFNEERIAHLKKGAKIINLSRGEIVNDDHMIAALDKGEISKYITDFPNPKIIQHPSVIAIPHLGASTPESEVNCAIMAARSLKEYIINGNISKSVNFPSVHLERSSEHRLAFCHQNIPNMISQISGAMAANNINIVNLINKSKDQIAYTILDIDQAVNEKVIKSLSEIQGMIKVRNL